ncbi:MAG: heparinase II/III family protein [Armatimonadota bacterium]
MNDPAVLNARVVAAGRPRLFFQRDGLEQLKQAIQTTHRDKWENLKAAVDRSLDDDPPEYRGIGHDPTRPGTPNDEMLWQRQFGYTIPGMALVALLDPDPKYFELVRKWALKPGEYPLWGAGVFEGSDLAASHQLFGISIAYDWLYDRWSPEDRERLRRILVEHGRVMYEAAEGINDRGWWKHEWRQNHSWCAYQALAVTGIALAGDEPDAGLWLAKGIWGGDHIIAELPDEGAYEEGIPYWGYGMESLLRLMAAAQPFLDRDLYAPPYFRHTPLFRLYMSGPTIPTVANFGDGPPRDWHSIRPLMYRLASQFRDPMAQWLAEALPDRRDLDATCWALLWHDPSVKPEISASQPLWYAFRQTGFASARTSWQPDALTLHLRSGKANVSHSHLDVNNFLVNAGGDWLLKDYGYGTVGPGYFDRRVPYFSNATVGHNCLAINGQDQRKDDDSVGVITDAREEDGVVWFRSDATKCYQGADSVVRELALVAPHDGTGKWGYLVVRDRARTAEPAAFDFMLQPGGQVQTDGDTFTIQCEHTRLVGRVLSPTSCTMSVLPGIGDHVNVESPLTLRISAPEKAREVEFVVVLVPLTEGEAAPEIAQAADGAGVSVYGEALTFAADGRFAPARR